MKSSSLLQGLTAGVDWSDLPRDLIESIFPRLHNPHDLFGFRSVCRSWRLAVFSLSPSPFFPRTISISESRPVTLIASAIYLLRPRRRRRSSSWLVSVQESAAGSLLLRHALTYQTTIALNSFTIDSSEWSATPFAMSYGHNALCGDCNQIERTVKLDLVPDLASGSNSVTDPNPEAMALWIDHWKGMYAWRFSLSKKSQTTSASRQEFTTLDCEIEDFVKLRGPTFYAIDSATCVYVFDCGDMRMNRLECEPVVDSGSAKSYRKRLVVSEGDLYMVLRFRHDFSHPPECLVYKLTKHNTTRWEWENVEDLGERVFFINRDCSFSVSAEDLPRPWRGNCVVLEKEGLPLCRCFQNDNEIEVFHFGTQLPRFSLLGMLQGFSDLFTPPSFIHD